MEGVHSEFVSVKSGVPQGSVLGPCLFLVYINDLPERLTSPARLFADDTTVYRAVISYLDQTQLQQDLLQLAEWEKNWDMSFHPGKKKKKRMIFCIALFFIINELTVLGRVVSFEACCQWAPLSVLD